MLSSPGRWLRIPCGWLVDAGAARRTQGVLSQLPRRRRRYDRPVAASSDFCHKYLADTAFRPGRAATSRCRRAFGTEQVLFPRHMLRRPLLLAALALAALPAPALAATARGRVTVTFDARHRVQERAAALTATPDGGVVAASPAAGPSGFGVARLRGDGTPEPSWG